MDAAELLDLLVAREETLATAESLTGGLLAGLVTDVAGASRAFRGGVVAYATDVKVSALGVDASVIDTHGVVSAECAEQMASAVRRMLGSTWGVATTGVAGPDSQDGHPVGTVWVAAAGPERVTSRLLSLSGDRSTIREDTCVAVLSLLGGILRGEETALG